jgi:hypothetical protein
MRWSCVVKQETIVTTFARFWRLFAGCLLIGGFALAQEDPPEPDPYTHESCTPMSAFTPEGDYGLCPKACGVNVSCVTLTRCVMYHPGYCDPTSANTVCNTTEIRLILNYMQECTLTSDCPNPEVEDQCKWLPTTQICGQQEHVDTCTVGPCPWPGHQ